MERLTSENYRSLLESYVSIYGDETGDLQEQENIQEFLQVIDELVEEGYDLSEYTYDELYEHYLAEGKGKAALELLKRAGGVLKKAGGQVLSGMKKPGKESLEKLGSGIVKVGVPVATAAGIDQFLTGGKGREWTGAAVQGVRQLGHSIPSPGKPATAKPKSEPPTPKSKPLKILGGQVVGYEDFDLFDAIKGHLLDEGYAETEEAAFVIMTNMSEDWRQSIIESIEQDGSEIQAKDD